MRQATHIHPDYKDSLNRLGLVRYENFLNPPDATIVSEVRDRVVYRLPGYYLKVFKNPGANGPFRQILSGEKPHSTAEIEVRRLDWLSDRGFPAPRRAAWGAVMNGFSEQTSFLLTEELRGLQAMDEWLVAVSEVLRPKEYRDEKRRLLSESARLLARLHEAGFHHPFPYLRHFFVPTFDREEWKIRGWNEAPEIAIIDVHSAVIASSVSPRNRSRGLAEWFVSSLRSPLSQTDRLRFIRAYCGGGADRDLVRRTFKRFTQKLRRHPNRFAWARERVKTLAFPESVSDLLP